MPSDRQEMVTASMQRLAAEWKTNSNQCSEIANFLKSPLATMFWQSQAANSFKTDIGKFNTALTQLQGAFKSLGEDVSARATQIEQTEAAAASV